MKKLLIILILLTATLSAQNLIDSTKKHYTPYKTSWYLGIGGTYPRYMAITAPSLANHRNYGFNLSLGYNLTEHIGARLMGNILSLESFTNNNGNEIFDRVNMGTINLDVIYTLFSCEYLTPYFIAGWGFALYTFDNPYLVPSKGQIRSDPDGIWDGYQFRFGGGLEYRMFDDISITAEINYITASNNRIDGNDTDNDHDKGILRSNGDSYMTAELGLRWYFSTGDTSTICGPTGIREVEVIKEVPVEVEKIIIDTVYIKDAIVGAVQQQKAFVLENVRFKFDKDILTEEAQIILTKVASVLNEYPEEKIEILGHTDNIGDDLYNMDLSERRAIAVKNYLISKGVDGDRLYPAGCGERKPVTDNSTDIGRAINRRIEFSIYDGVSTACPKLETQSERNETQISDAIESGESLVLEGVYFKFNSDELTAESKTILTNAANVLSKYPNSPIEIHGHTDSIGDKAYNKELSLRRAISVKNYLATKGIAKSRMTTFGHGEELPIDDNSTSYGRAKNRRMEFKLTGGYKGVENKNESNIIYEEEKVINENITKKEVIAETVKEETTDNLSAAAKKMEAQLLSDDKFVLNNLHFVFDKDILVEESKQILVDATSVLKKHSDINIRIEGHTDNIGADDYNQYLSIMRANAVKRYLIENGIAKSRLTTKGFGEKNPIATNKTDAGRALNRRIEFRVVK